MLSSQKLGYFKRLNFIFLIVGHTKNACYCLFNSLKMEYRQYNILTMECLLCKLDKLEFVIIIPTSKEDCFDSNTLLVQLSTRI